MFEKPEHLSSVGGTAFDRVQAELAEAGITGAGFDVIERYAVTYSLWLECQARVRSEGAAWGDGTRNQRMIDLHKLNAAVASIRRELGLGVLKVEGETTPRGGTTESDEVPRVPLRYKFRELN